ncbi:MAG: hypothetical protein HKP55_06095 [Gammaproteobacteria bacterium]|nr:hypothetical protein [Gammaproteobacteria bacterium]
MSKVLIWLVSGDRAKLEPGILWGVNATNSGWVDEVRFVVFGESQKLLLEDQDLFEMVNEIQPSMFCLHLAESQNIKKDLEEKGANLIDVGEPIAEAIKEGFQVITF